jgi:hypothetical protein
MKKFNWKWFILGVLVVLGLMWFLSYGKGIGKAEAVAQSCSSLNANCANANDKSCCPGLSCLNGQGGYKCRTAPTSTPTPTVKPTATPTPTPVLKWCHDWDDGKCVEEQRTNCNGKWDNGKCPSPSPSPTPTPIPVKDYCKNLDGIQEVLPDGMVVEEGFCSCALGYHEVIESNGLRTLVVADGYNNFTCEKDVIPEPQPAPACTSNCGSPPTFAGSSTNPPVCGDRSTINLPANSHVIRKGEQATVNFFITEGDSANIYWREVGQSNWQHAVSNVKPNGDMFVSFVIHELKPNVGYDFGIQQVRGCGGGQLVTAVIVDGPEAQTFGFSYWEWSK